MMGDRAMLKGLLFALPLVLLACVPAFVPSPVIDPLPVVDPMPKPTPRQGTCGAEDMQDLLGQSADKLKVMRFAGPMRVILPGMMVAMDYQADRVTITVDRAGNISKVVCG
jgi:Peptidase inhibitor I78 family